MTQEYDVRMGDKSLGRALVRQEGLYFRISIRCDLPGDVMYKVTVRGAEADVDLGILIPVDGAFGLDTQIPAKRLGDGVLSFVAKPRHRSLDGQFIPLSPQEPFGYISKLKEAFLVRRNGEVGLMFRRS